MVFQRHKNRPQAQPLECLNILLAQLAKPGTAEQRIEAGLASLRRVLGLRRLELFLFEPEKTLAYKVAAVPAQASEERLADPSSRPELFNAAPAKRRRAVPAQLFPLFYGSKRLGGLAVTPASLSPAGQRFLACALPAAAALLAPVLRETDLYRVFYQALPALQKAADEERREILKLLAGSFAHRLNQPLTAILAYLDLLKKRQELPPELMSYVQKTGEEAQRLHHLLQEIGSLNQAAVEQYVGEAQILALQAPRPAEGGRPAEVGPAQLSILFELISSYSKMHNREAMLAGFARLLARHRGLSQMAYFEPPAEKNGSPRLAFQAKEQPLAAAVLEKVAHISRQAGREVGLFFLSPLGESRGRGVIIPLSMQRVPLGLLFLEFPCDPPRPLTVAEEKLLLALCGQLALSLLGQRFVAESSYWKEYLQDLLRSANALIFAVDAQRRISLFNRAMEKTSGYRQEEILGRPVNILFAEERALTAFEEAYRRAAAGQEVRNLELSLQTRDGQLLPAVFNLAAVVDPDGAGVGLMAVGQDLSELRSLEQQVIQSEKLAYFGQMSASFVHELNNPLTSISVYADYLLRRMQAAHADAETVEKLQKILASAERIQSFTQNLTSFARPANRDNLEEVDLREVLREAVSFTEHETSQAGIEVGLALPDQLSPIWAVRSQLQQVFINLIINARQAIPGRGRIAIRAEEYEGEQIRVTVEDNGVGIEPMFLGKIFDPFFSTKARGEGTGLGLSIVKRIVDNHLGTIRVTSAKGQGTCFSLFLPKTALRDKLAGGGAARPRPRSEAEKS